MACSAGLSPGPRARGASWWSVERALPVSHRFNLDAGVGVSTDHIGSFAPTCADIRALPVREARHSATRVVLLGHERRPRHRTRRRAGRVVSDVGRRASSSPSSERRPGSLDPGYLRSAARLRAAGRPPRLRRGPPLAHHERGADDALPSRPRWATSVEPRGHRRRLDGDPARAGGGHRRVGRAPREVGEPEGRVEGPSLRLALRRADRLSDAEPALPADAQQRRSRHRRGAVAEQARRVLQRGGRDAAVSDHKHRLDRDREPAPLP